MKSYTNEGIKKVIVFALFFLFAASTLIQVSGKTNTINNSSIELNTSITYESSSHILIESPQGRKLASQLVINGYDVLRDTITDYTLELIVTPYELNALKQQNFNINKLSKN